MKNIVFLIIAPMFLFSCASTDSQISKEAEQGKREAIYTAADAIRDNVNDVIRDSIDGAF